MTLIPNLKWAPRLARLYSADVRRLETIHANHLSPGTKTWQQAVDQLAQRMTKAGPAKGARLIKRAIDYLSNIDPDQRCHFIISTSCRSRNALLMFATFSYGEWFAAEDEFDEKELAERIPFHPRREDIYPLRSGHGASCSRPTEGEPDHGHFDG